MSASSRRFLYRRYPCPPEAQPEERDAFLALIDWERRLARSTEQLGRAAHDLVMWYVLKALGEAPAVSKRIDDLPVAFAPESVLQGGMHLRAFPYSLQSKSSMIASGWSL
jgi:hypothetical protein